ncbi:peptidoglycan-binding domain-containing protein [Streptomyces sp. N35]|uniref:peptidoglycan-binding domain-containing protein n=1 Tax=Streptomyces sp. N35 TaxID=2795730 RepID=UPI0018F4EC07|nr:peptidoglycan-binding domain-containing protein [Streptomyces sp. N35]
MMKSRTARTTSGLIAGVIAASGMGVVATAGPAHAASTCTGSYAWKFSSSFFTWLPARGDTTICNLASGNSGSAVARLQNTLVLCYGQHIVVDGNFGRNTKLALEAAQRVEKIEDDGLYGFDTRRSLKWPKRNIKGETWTGTCIRAW